MKFNPNSTKSKNWGSYNQRSFWHKLSEGTTQTLPACRRGIISAAILDAENDKEIWASQKDPLVPISCNSIVSYGFLVQALTAKNASKANI